MLRTCKQKIQTCEQRRASEKYAGQKIMKYIFISGTPASGKSYLANKIANHLGVQHVSTDDWREEMRKNPELKKWVDFFWDQDEAEYWRITNCDQQWENLKNQSEALWPTILAKVKEIQKPGKGAIFEGVNILPHLARIDLDFEGIILLGESFKKILDRNKKDPRWGKTEELQIQEAKVFWGCERPKYKQEAEKYGYKVFSDAGQAEAELLKLLSK